MKYPIILSIVDHGWVGFYHLEDLFEHLTEESIPLWECTVFMVDGPYITVNVVEPDYDLRQIEVNRR